MVIKGLTVLKNAEATYKIILWAGVLKTVLNGNALARITLA